MSLIFAAPIELADLIAVMRPDWDRTHVEGWLQSVRERPWEGTWALVSRLLLDPDSSPRDLTVATRDPLTRDIPAPCTYERGLALAREAMTQKGDAA